MALVHSRIRRLVYALPAAEGALGSKYRLHTIPSINHHYQVVRGFLSEEAGQRLERAGMGARQGTDRMAG
jgi:tRNA-specific adenosine deaminase 3